MPATQDNGNDRVRSLRPRKPRDVASSDDCKGSQNGEVSEGPSVHRPARQRGAKLSMSSSKPAGKSEGAKQGDTFVKVQKECRLGSQAWTDKYKPSKSCAFVGNDATIAELRSWLLQWKNKPSNAERSNSRHSLSDSEDSTEGLSNCYLLVGPPGVGKTSSVYYLAEELGFKVLEVHASSERPGKKILTELHEATQSHHVEGSRLLFPAVAAPSTTASTDKAKVQKKAKSTGPLQQMFERAAAKSQEKPAKMVDDGFWSAVESVLTITKKPVIFTATRNLMQIRTKLPSGCPVAEFAHPKPDEVSKLALHIFKSEDVPTVLQVYYLLTV
ncbi:hypothetical protein HPB49_012061 [Dermacentor silvarum]|uniref:Uncharacterized protein n=1 Tax=Dermacentor silvarum TaxID=543639 RepID=A0ACB8CX85_DERSI|nr:hypothetical protein HPB49_012061 [Dermacentor silvarum]